MLKRLAERFRALNPTTRQAPPARAAILDQYVREAPAPQHALDIFKGDWWSSLPGELSRLQAGQLPLFDDSRIHWAIEALGGVSGKRVLELGPLEGGHTYLLERAGAQSDPRHRGEQESLPQVPDREGASSGSSARASCSEISRSSTCAQGVSASMPQSSRARSITFASPSSSSRTSRALPITYSSGLSTYVKERLDAIPHMAHRFGESHEAEFGGFRHTRHPYYYRDFLDTSRFAGGTEEFSHWLSRADLLGALRHAGLAEIVVGEEDLEHPNGPCISPAARRPGA